MRPIKITRQVQIDLARWNADNERARRAYYADTHCVSCGIRKRDGRKRECWTCRKRRRRDAARAARRTA